MEYVQMSVNSFEKGDEEELHETESSNLDYDEMANAELSFENKLNSLLHIAEDDDSVIDVSSCDARSLTKDYHSEVSSSENEDASDSDREDNIEETQAIRVTRTLSKGKETRLQEKKLREGFQKVVEKSSSPSVMVTRHAAAMSSNRTKSSGRTVSAPRRFPLLSPPSSPPTQPYSATATTSTAKSSTQTKHVAPHRPVSASAPRRFPPLTPSSPPSPLKSTAASTANKPTKAEVREKRLQRRRERYRREKEKKAAAVAEMAHDACKEKSPSQETAQPARMSTRRSSVTPPAAAENTATAATKNTITPTTTKNSAPATKNSGTTAATPNSTAAKNKNTATTSTRVKSSCAISASKPKGKHYSAVTSPTTSTLWSYDFRTMLTQQNNASVQTLLRDFECKYQHDLCKLMKRKTQLEELQKQHEELADRQKDLLQQLQDVSAGLAMTAAEERHVLLKTEELRVRLQEAALQACSMNKMKLPHIPLFQHIKMAIDLSDDESDIEPANKRRKHR